MFKTRFPMAQSLPLYIVTEAASECVRPSSVKLVKSNRIMIPWCLLLLATMCRYICVRCQRLSLLVPFSLRNWQCLSKLVSWCAIVQRWVKVKCVSFWENWPFCVVKLSYNLLSTFVNNCFKICLNTFLGIVCNVIYLKPFLLLFKLLL